MNMKANVATDPTSRKLVRRKQGRPTGTDDGVGRRAILNTACELIRTLPPEKVTRAEVARRAGVAPRLIHYYFRDRASLLQATAQALSDLFQQQASASVKDNDPPEIQLRRRIEAFLRFQLQYPYFHRLMIEEVVGREGTSQSLLHGLSARGVAGYERILELGVSAGTMRPVDSALFYLVVIGIVELATSGRPILLELGKSDATGPDYASRYSEFVADLLVNGLRVSQSDES